MKKAGIALSLLLAGCAAFNGVEANNAVSANSQSVAVKPQPPTKSPTKPPYRWNLAWYDDFSAGKLDTTKWVALDRKDNFNSELQYYLPRNVEQSNGQLRLVAKRENVQGKSYTSGLVDTYGKMAFLYGRVEVRAKYEKGKGLFPAVWLLPTDKRNHLPEVDIMEAIGSDPETVYMVHHWDTTGKSRADYATSKVSNYSEFHEYAFEWHPDELRWYIDGKLKYRTRRGVYQKPMYLVMNLAVGGNWEGPPNNSTKFPSALTIDYVRVYSSNVYK
jgi:beta-glucanase (GH16 family)